MNLTLAREILASCARAGVRELVLCAGARNAPLVSLLSQARGVRTYSFFEERSAGFFALGRILATGRAVAVITTSGTAAAELLPAVIEADHQGLPLLVLTADRPRRYRGSGAPQAIVQPGLYSHYVEKTYDIEGSWQDELSLRMRPVHINICFDEPLLDEELKPWDWPPPSAVKVASASEHSSPVCPQITARRPLVIIGGLPEGERARVEEIVRGLRRPVYAEATSGLREKFPRVDVSRVAYDGVIRIGSVPTVRLWRDLENSDLPVWHFSHLPYSGMSRVRDVSPLSALQHYEFEADRGDAQAAAPDFSKQPLSEPGWINWLSRQISPEAVLFLGNSLPIREWDLAAEHTPSKIFANRGVNGIEGLFSTFLGLADDERENWCVVGDLSALYDLSGPWALRDRPLCKVNFVVINNGGGKIFERIFRNPLFENRHDLNFEPWARLWNLDYLCLLQPPQRLEPAQRPRVIEIQPDPQQTEAFWNQLG